MGRPSKYSKPLADKISVRLATGESLRSICRDDGMPSVSTVLLWVVNGKYPEFSEQYARAREAQGHYHVDEMLDLRHGVLDGSIEPQAARVIADIIKWSSERMARKSFSAKSTEAAQEDAETPISKIQVEVIGAKPKPPTD